MAITFHTAKRAKVLQERGIDLARMGEVFAGDYVTIPDRRFNYGEDPFITAGDLDGRLVVIAWTKRDGDIHVISARHAHAKESRRWRNAMGGSG